MANGNRRTLADCDQRMAEMREQINDLREERDRLAKENNGLRSAIQIILDQRKIERGELL